MSATTKTIAIDIAENARRVRDEMRAPFTKSQKIYVEGEQPGVRVPMREIHCSPTRTEAGLEPNPSVTVYDTSGPYQDPGVEIDLLAGLPALRAGWIEARGDTEQLDGPSSEFGQHRAADLRRRAGDPDRCQRGADPRRDRGGRGGAARYRGGGRRGGHPRGRPAPRRQRRLHHVRAVPDGGVRPSRSTA